MIRVNLDELRVKHARATGRRGISLRDIAEETGLGYPTVQRLSAGKAEGITFPVLEKLCVYFSCDAGELLEYVPDNSASTQQ